MGSIRLPNEKEINVAYEEGKEAVLKFCNYSREIWLKQKRQDGRPHQLHQFLKSVPAVAFCGVQGRG